MLAEGDVVVRDDGSQVWVKTRRSTMNSTTTSWEPESITATTAEVVYVITINEPTFPYLRLDVDPGFVPRERFFPLFDVPPPPRPRESMAGSRAAIRARKTVKTSTSTMVHRMRCPSIGRIAKARYSEAPR